MTKRTPATPEAGPAAPEASSTDVALRQMMDGVMSQPVSSAESELVDRLAEAVTDRLADHPAQARRGEQGDEPAAPAQPGGGAVSGGSDAR